MCDTCGCNLTPGNKHLVENEGKLATTSDGKASIDILQSLLSENDQLATHNRQHFDKHQVLAINLMSSPGSGKTALLEATIDSLRDEFNIAVIEGDLETENDADRIRAKGVTAIQITTGTACHLDAHMVHDALHHMDLAPLDIVFIENVGNLVCPASFDLGHHHNVTLLSVTEGDDKPEKYPVIFRTADLMLLTKTDLLAVLDDFEPAKVEHHLRQLANAAPVFQISVKHPGSLQQWTNWLGEKIRQHKHRINQGRTLRPVIQPDGLQLHTHHQHEHHHDHD